MKNYSISKTIALSLGVLVMSLLISFMVLAAWTEPDFPPPEGNVAGPLLSEPDELNLAGATWDERDIINIDEIIGYNDLFLRGNSTGTATVHMFGDKLKFYTGETERMTIDSSGDIGIGITTPQGKLEVQGDMWITFSGDDGLRIRPGLDTGYQYGFTDQYGNLQAFINEQGRTNQALVLGDTGSTGTGILFGVSVGSDLQNPSTGGLIVGGGTETWIPRFAITGAGNVGIGTTAPGAKLHVVGQVKITGGSPGANRVLTSDSDGLASWETHTASGLWEALGTDIYNTNIDNVGIGTTVPKNSLHIHSTVYPYIQLTNNTTGSGSNSVGVFFGIDGATKDFNIWQASNAATKFYTNALERVRIDSSGSVGIGTTNPGSKLHVSGGTGSVNILIEADTDNSGEADQPSITLRQDGGTIEGRLGYFNSTNQLTLKNVYNNALHLGTNNVNRLTILGNGNVGIGIASPAQKLDVNGNIRVRAIINCDQLGTDSSGNLICVSEPLLTCASEVNGTCELVGDCIGNYGCNFSSQFECSTPDECCCVWACLEEGSLVLTPGGFRKIEELKSGDYVIGYKDGKEMEAKITETFIHEGEWTLYSYQGSWFTGDHRVSTDFENFEEVSKLTDVTKQYTGKVYNLEVAETENYFGENNLLIHNK